MRIGMRPIATMMKAAFKADRRNFIICLTLYIVSALVVPVFALSLGALTDSLRNDTSTVRISAIAIGLAVTASASHIVIHLAWQIVRIVQERTEHYIDRQMLQTMMDVPSLEHYETPEYLDKVERLRDEHWLLGSSVPMILSSTTILVQLIATMVLLARIEWILILLPLFGVPAVIANVKAETKRNQGRDQLQEEWRKSDDVFNIVTDSGAAKEVRVFGLGPELLQRHQRSSQKSYERELGDRLIGANWIALSRLLFVLCYALALAVVVYRVVDGGSSTGDLLVSVMLAGQFLNQLMMASGEVGWLFSALTAVTRFQWLIDYGKEHHGDGVPGTAVPTRVNKGIRFENVSFAYPGTTRPVIEGLSLDLPAGSTVAIIGDNGAGKSTLIKLMTRMYEPTGGRIYVDDTPLEDMDVRVWREQVSAAFQDHARLEVRTQYTVGLGDLPNVDDRQLVTTAVQAAGVSDLVERLPHGLDTQLGGSWDGGVDLSGGQWQKLSLARGLMRDPLLLVLDEPTSALDAETEHGLFERFASTAASRAADSGTITVLVSHRFSTVRMADLIVVISSGKVAESGSHEALMAKDGLYAELYELQARAYR